MMEFLNRTLDRCIDAGADSAEVFRMNQKVMSLSVRDGRVETIEKSTPGGLAIRFIKDNKTAFAHTTDLSEKSVKDIIARAKNMAVKTEPDEFTVLPDAGQYGRDLEIYSDSRSNVSMDEKIAYLEILEKLAMGYDTLVDKSNGVWCREVLSELDLVNSNGIEASYKSSLYNLGLSIVVTRNGEMFPGEGWVNARYFDDLMPGEDLVDKNVSRALRLVGGTTIEGGDYEIIFTPRAVNSILWGLSFALNGEEVLKGASFLAGKKGEAFASEKLNLYDDAVMIRGVASRPFDYEGVPSRKNKLIDKGVLAGFLYDSRTAARAGERSTGSATRQDYNDIPSISTSNFYFEAGTDNVDDVVRSCGKGIIVENVHGWGLYSVNGQFSAGINGTLVKNGKRVKPVANVTIAAGPEDLFKGIGAVCDDLAFYDDFSSPTIMIKKMRVGA